MAQSGGEVAADAGVDRISALPDDLLLLILLRLDTITEAAQTSVLSSRWRRVWALLPVFRFPNGRHIREALAASEAPVLRGISITAYYDTADSVAAWLPLAAHRLSGQLMYDNVGPERYDYDKEEEEGNEEEEAVPLPCFGNAIVIDLNLGFLRLALPSSGAFDQLSELALKRVRFQAPADLGDVVSSPRCPGLKVLIVGQSSGLDTLTVHSTSLLKMELVSLNGFRKLTIDAPDLKELILHHCFVGYQPVADIATPRLFSLRWGDAYDPSSVHLGNLGQLQKLSTRNILVYGQEHTRMYNHNIQLFWQRFQAIHSLDVMLNYYRLDTSNSQYLMEEITCLPHVTFLTMSVQRGEHIFGASVFHVLRLCARITKLLLNLQPHRFLMEQSQCHPGCFCEQPTNWKTEELLLISLKEVDVGFLEGCENEIAFVKLLFNWAPVLEKMTITFDDSILYSKAMELCQTISSFSRPETCVEFYIYNHAGNKMLRLRAPEDQGTGM